MLGRKTRPVDAVASPATNTAVYSSNNDDITENLSRLADEEDWEQQHAAIVWQYNKTSLAFWVLCICSLCFALLNGHHGFTSSEKTVGLYGAAFIAILYFAIEFTIPVSSHLVSWEGSNKILIRICGIFALLLGIAFSLVILQSKFASGSDGASARSKIIARTITSDSSEMDAAKENIDKLRAKVGSNSPAKYLAEMKAIMATQINRRDTLGDATNECQDNKRTSQQKDLCARYEQAKANREDALTLEREEARYATLKSSLRSSSSEAIGDADAADKVWSRIFKINIEDIKTFKASIIAMAAALLTHLLWLAHGATVNSAIARKREALFNRKKLVRYQERAVTAQTEAERAASEAAAKAAQSINDEFLSARNTQHKVLKAIESAPLHEQPAVLQIKKYYLERSIMTEGMSAQVANFHDDYIRWSRQNSANPVVLDRFISITREIGLGISSDGRVVGATLK